MGSEVALVTGASAGIGREFARQLAARGHGLLLVARRTDRLNELAREIEAAHSIRPHVLPADLAEPGAPEAVLAFAREHDLDINILVNNAGFGARGRFAELECPNQLNMIGVNVTALVHLTRLVLPAMLERGKGRVLNVASTAAFVPGPYMAVYYASKAFVLSFSEALLEETRGSGVTVSCLCPGPVATEFGEISGLASSRVFDHPVPVEPVVGAAIRGMERGKDRIVPGLMLRISTFFLRLTPRGVPRRVVARLQE